MYYRVSTDGSPDVEHSLALIHQMKEWGTWTNHSYAFMWPRLHSKTLHKPSGRHTPGFAKRPIWTNWELNSATPQNTEWTITFWAYCKEKKSYPCRATISLSKTLFYNRSGTSKVSSSICRSNGLSPILAHPERYAYYYDDKKIIQRTRMNKGVNFKSIYFPSQGITTKERKRWPNGWFPNRW